jgi:hypothetical protein
MMVEIDREWWLRNVEEVAGLLRRATIELWGGND